MNWFWASIVGWITIISVESMNYNYDVSRLFDCLCEWSSETGWAHSWFWKGELMFFCKIFLKWDRNSWDWNSSKSSSQYHKESFSVLSPVHPTQFFLFCLSSALCPSLLDSSMIFGPLCLVCRQCSNYGRLGFFLPRGERGYWAQLFLFLFDVIFYFRMGRLYWAVLVHFLLFIYFFFFVCSPKC